EKRAYELASKARELLSTDAELARTLGKLNYRRKDYANALHFLQEGIQNRASDPEGLFYLVMAHYQLKENLQSKQALEQALALSLSAPLAAEARPVLAELNAQ